MTPRIREWSNLANPLWKASLATPYWRTGTVTPIPFSETQCLECLFLIPCIICEQIQICTEGPLTSLFSLPLLSDPFIKNSSLGIHFNYHSFWKWHCYSEEGLPCINACRLKNGIFPFLVRQIPEQRYPCIRLSNWQRWELCPVLSNLKNRKAWCFAQFFGQGGLSRTW